MKKLVFILAGMSLVFALGAVPASADCDLCGDVDGNGYVNISDAVALVNWFSDPFHYPPHVPAAAMSTA